MEEQAYILGTERAELHRLGIQHMVWAKEAFEAWSKAKFKQGDALLDLGCGPGFLSRDLAYIAGNEGKVIAVDRSQNFIDFLDQEAKFHGLNIDARCMDFNDLVLEENSLDGAYSRWALAWVPNADEIALRIAKALKPGASFVCHEYHSWMDVHTQPLQSNLQMGLQATFDSFQASAGDINIGAGLPQIFEKAGLKVSFRPISKTARPESMEWNWPKSFLLIYMPKLVAEGLLDPMVHQKAVEEIAILENTPGAYWYTPPLLEVIACKV